MLSEFRQSVEQSLDLPLTLNLYESQFYSKDGALDFSSTSSCFQLVGKDHVFGLKDTELLLNAERNQRLRGVYDKFGVGNVEVSKNYLQKPQEQRLALCYCFLRQRCVPRGALYEINNLEIWLLAIGSMIGAVGLIAALTTCCLFTKYNIIIASLASSSQVIAIQFSFYHQQVRIEDEEAQSGHPGDGNWSPKKAVLCPAAWSRLSIKRQPGQSLRGADDAGQIRPLALFPSLFLVATYFCNLFLALSKVQLLSTVFLRRLVITPFSL